MNTHSEFTRSSTAQFDAIRDFSSVGRRIGSILMAAVAVISLSAASASASGIIRAVPDAPGLAMHANLASQLAVSKDGLTGFLPHASVSANPSAFLKVWYGCNPYRPNPNVGPCHWGVYEVPWWMDSFAIVSGPKSNSGSVSQAVAFTAGKSGAVSEVNVALGSISGTNGVNIGLYNDAGGIPGTPMQSGDVTGLGDIGTCCTYSSIKFPKTKLLAGAQYWVVLSTDENNTDAVAGAYTDVTNETNPVTMAVNYGSGWESYTTTQSFNLYVK